MSMADFYYIQQNEKCSHGYQKQNYKRHYCVPIKKTPYSHGYVRGENEKCDKGYRKMELVKYFCIKPRKK